MFYLQDYLSAYLNKIPGNPSDYSVCRIGSVKIKLFDFDEETEYYSYSYHKWEAGIDNIDIDSIND